MPRGYRREGISPELIKRLLIYGLLLLLLAAAESSFFARLRYLPATPDLMLGAVIAATLLDSRKAGAVFGVVGGFVSDALGTTGISLRPILYLLVVLTVGALASKMMTGFPAYWMLMLPALLCRGLFSIGQGMLLWGHAPLGEVLRYAVLPELLCTALFCLPLYGIVKLCMLLFRSGRDRLRL